MADTPNEQPTSEVYDPEPPSRPGYGTLVLVVAGIIAAVLIAHAPEVKAFFHLN